MGLTHYYLVGHTPKQAHADMHKAWRQRSAQEWPRPRLTLPGRSILGSCCTASHCENLASLHSRFWSENSHAADAFSRLDWNLVTESYGSEEQGVIQAHGRKLKRLTGFPKTEKTRKELWIPRECLSGWLLPHPLKHSNKFRVKSTWKPSPFRPSPLLRG